MRLYKIENLRVRAYVESKSIFKKDSTEAVGSAALVCDYIFAHDEQSAYEKIRSNPVHYMHWGWSGTSLGGSLYSELDSSKTVYVEDVRLLDVTDFPPRITALRDRMDAHDYLSYCSKYIYTGFKLENII